MKRLPLTAYRSDSKGVALIIVLSMLVLLSGLLVAFLTTARTERTAAASDAATAQSRQIADSTVSFVISQIRDATTNPAEGVTWASQPGAIRTFGGALNGKPRPLKNNAYYDGYTPDSSKDEVFKLYSSDRMRVSSSDYANVDLGLETGVIEGWDRTDPTDGYVDLNEPVLSLRRDLSPNGDVVEPHYPIVDPRAAYAKTGGETSVGNGIVNGFDGKIEKDQTFKMEGSASVPYIPMPVKWLYVLRDGTIGPASLGTEDNPIVGRTAFWTDDDSCKLNINTASEGTFWDTPMASMFQECGPYEKSTGEIKGAAAYSLNLAGSQAVQGEYPRYPGHPASTCLSPALGWIWDVLPTTSVFPYAAGAPNKVYNNFKEAIYQLSPYTPYDLGTSQGATRNTDNTASALGELTVKTKHLYTSVDEIMFKSARFKGQPGSGGGDPETTNPIKPADLEKTRFFLTANSRAPEINLLGRPRVNIWPINADYKYRTAADDLFIFTSKINKNPGGKDKMFCLLRGDAKGATVDFDGNWTSGNDNQNQKMFSYLQDLTSRPVPGFGKTFTDSRKWGGNVGRDEMLIMIFDYIRTINLTDTGTTTRTANVFAPYTPRFFGTTAAKPDQYQRYERSYDWAGQVTPLRRVAVPRFDLPDEQLQGLGRFVLPTEVAVVFNTIQRPSEPQTPGGQPYPAGKYMQATMVIEMGTVMPGLPAIRETYWTRVTPLRASKVQFAGSNEIKTINLCGPCYRIPGQEPDKKEYLRGLINIPNISSHEVCQGRGFMPTLGFSTAFYYFREHKGFTLLGAAHATDTNRVGDYNTISIKTFTNKRAENRYQGNHNGIDDGRGYVRSTGTGNGTLAFYPYVSDPIFVPTKQDPNSPNDPTKTVNATQFIIHDLGEYKIDIYVGEAPTDPRSTLGVGRLSGEPADMPLDRPVQTLYVSFPGTDVESLPTVNLPVPPDYGSGPPTLPAYSDLRSRAGVTSSSYVENPSQFIEDTRDVVRSMQLVCIPNFGGTNVGQAGDLRLAAAHAVVPKEWWAPVNDVSSFRGSTRVLHRLTRGHGDPDKGYPTTASDSTHGNLVAGASMRTNKPPILPMQTNGVRRADGGPGDFDRGMSKHVDGAFGNKVDEGNLKFDPSKSDYTGMPYYRGRGIEETGQTWFSPNRQIASAVMFGSLPTGIRSNLVDNKPWQTLLFRPNREATSTHPGADPQQGPPDHLLLDLFTLPVIEPYAISEPFSTAGKININYVIAPFGYARGEGGNNPGTSNPRSYLYRDTGVRGLLKSTMIMAVPKNVTEGGHTENPQSVTTRSRYAIDLNKTIEAMETRLKNKDDQYPLFRSASEICTVDLYPQDLSVGSWNTFWADQFPMTGDNMRERPYAHIYPRVTTKSNVYTVHMRCQAIRKAKGTPPNQFDPDKDAVLGEYRGSATVERFIDPNDDALKNYNELQQKVDPYYRYRVTNTKQFSSR